MKFGPEPTDPGSPRPPLAGGLYVVATPIGNLRDITLRALDVLAGAQIIAAEDTRVARKLLSAFGLSGRIVAYHEHNAAAQEPMLLASLAAGHAVALTSDAGTPLVSDPGARLVQAALDAGHRVIPIPGPCAAIAALSVAGLPSERFLFAGFAPAKSGPRQAFFSEFAAAPATLIFYETGPRLAESLADMALVFGDREAAVARELTKLFEEVRRAPLAALAETYAGLAAPKGEIVVLVGPPPPPEAPDDEALDAFILARLASHSVKETAGLAAAALGVARQRAYQRALLLAGRR